MVLVASCKKDKDPFTGKDKYIASFSLKQGSVTLHATIANNVISIAAPDSLTLTGATAAVTMSEHATIYPDPAAIKDWDEDHQFAVNARNGEQLTYRFTVVRKHIDAAGTVVLETQADVNAFGAKGFTAVGGNLVIGRTTGLDSISTLAPLDKLKVVAYSLIIYPTYTGADLAGLDKLEQVGGDIRMDGLKYLAGVQFPALQSAGDVYIKNTLVGVAAFPELTKVSRAFTLDAPLSEVKVPNLQTVGGAVTLNTANGSNAMLARVNFPALEKAGAFICTMFKNATKVELPALQQVGDMNFNQTSMLTVLLTPNVQVSTGTIAIPFTTYLAEVSFPKLTEAKTITVDSKTIRLMDFPKLKTVKDRLALQNASINGLGNFKSLERVEGELYLYELASMTKLDLPANLQYVGRLTIGHRLATPFTEIDIRQLNVGELKVMANTIKAKLIANPVFKGTLTVSSNNATNLNGYPPFPTLVGFNEVDSLSLDGYVSAMDTVHIRNIRKINKGFRLDNNNIKRFSLPDLEEIGGNFYFARLDQGVDPLVEFAKLKKIGGSFDVSIGSTVTRTLRFTALESVGGDFRLGTGYSATRSLENVLFPSLKTIGGAMVLHGYGGTTTNLSLKNLDGFVTLSSVRSIEVTNQKAIVSFAGLKEAVKAVSAAGWKTSGNNYNPTYADLQNGNWVAP